MSEVKRYDMRVSLGGVESYESPCGYYVDYDDYAALEAKCAALAAELKQIRIDADCYKKGMEASNSRLVQLAAENAALKAAHPQPFGHEMMKALDAYEKHQDEVPETGMLDAFFILRDSIRVTTPVTDAWVNEQHAIGVGMVVKYHMERAEALKEVNRKGYFYHSSSAMDALDVAAQLRQKVISEQD